MPLRGSTQTHAPSQGHRRSLGLGVMFLYMVCIGPARVSSTQTPTSTLSVTRSQTQSGFPRALVFGDADYPFGSGNRVREINASTWRGVFMYWPERDPRCGPGQYRLDQFAVQLTQAPSSGNVGAFYDGRFARAPCVLVLSNSSNSFPSASTAVMLSISLYTSDNVTRQLGTLIASVTFGNSVSSTCYFSVISSVPIRFRN